MNKKQVVVTFLLVSLMIILAITQGFFVNNFSRVSVVENSQEIKVYSFEDYDITFPNDWIIEEEEEKDKYISYNIDFKNKDKNIQGTLQLINTAQDIREYAERDLKTQSLDYYNSKMIPFNNPNNMGVLSEYNTDINGGYSYINKCYYVKGDDGQILKVLFYIRTDKDSKSVDDKCSEVISSIKQNK